MECVWNEQKCLFCVDDGKEISFHEANIIKFSIAPDSIRIGLRLSDYINPTLPSYFVWLNFDNWKYCTFDYDAAFSKDDWFDDSILSIEKDDTGIQIEMEFLWTVHIATDTYTVNIETDTELFEKTPRFEISEALTLKTDSKQLDPENANFELPYLSCFVKNEKH